MCLTGVDYFSTLGYQPGIAFIAAGALSPIATLILVLLTLFGALPIYNRVAAESPHGEGSISMLEHLLSRWKGKLFVLVLLGFVATDFVITITLSAADATAHVIENPFVDAHLPFLNHRIGVTLVLISAPRRHLPQRLQGGDRHRRRPRRRLSAAEPDRRRRRRLSAHYAARRHCRAVEERCSLRDPRVHGNPLLMIGVALLLFPKLALGLSGFETGVAVMPLVRGDRALTREDLHDIHSTRTGRRQPPPSAQALLEGRIRNTRKLLLTAALIMSVLLISSSFVTDAPHPEPEKFRRTGGEASGRALALSRAQLLRRRVRHASTT